MTIRFPIALAALVLVGACNKPAADTTVQSSTETTADGVAQTTMITVNTTVQTAAAISKAMKQFPAKGDSILTAFNMTATQFADLMNQIAADSTMSAEYRRLTQ